MGFNKRRVEDERRRAARRFRLPVTASRGRSFSASSDLADLQGSWRRTQAKIDQASRSSPPKRFTKISDPAKKRKNPAKPKNGHASTRRAGLFGGSPRIQSATHAKPEAIAAHNRTLSPAPQSRSMLHAAFGEDLSTLCTDCSE